MRVGFQISAGLSRLSPCVKGGLRSGAGANDENFRSGEEPPGLLGRFSPSPGALAIPAQDRGVALGPRPPRPEAGIPLLTAACQDSHPGLDLRFGVVHYRRCQCKVWGGIHAFQDRLRTSQAVSSQVCQEYYRWVCILRSLQMEGFSKTDQSSKPTYRTSFWHLFCQTCLAVLSPSITRDDGPRQRSTV